MTTSRMPQTTDGQIRMASERLSGTRTATRTRTADSDVDTDVDTDADTDDDAELDTGVPQETDPPRDCPMDSVSPNHSQNDAYVLSEQTGIEGLVVCAGQEDWFRLELPALHEMALEVCVPNNIEAPDLELFRAEYPYPQYYLAGGSYGSAFQCRSTNLWDGVVDAGASLPRSQTGSPRKSRDPRTL
jgi:hypothetical protein